MIQGKHTNNRRRGSIYVIVLGTSMCVATIGLAAMLAVRVDRRVAGDCADMVAARFYARSAIEKAFQIVYDQPTFRATYGGADIWLSDVAIGAGTFTLTVTDPEDGDIESTPNNFLVFTGTGVKGDATYTIRATVEAASGGYQVQSGTWQQVVP